MCCNAWRRRGFGVAPGRRAGYVWRMDVVINFMIVAALIAVVVPLVLGGVTLVRGGPGVDASPEAARLRGEASNRFMRWRVTMQAVAVGVLCFAFWWKSQN